VRKKISEFYLVVKATYAIARAVGVEHKCYYLNEPVILHFDLKLRQHILRLE